MPAWTYPPLSLASPKNYIPTTGNNMTHTHPVGGYLFPLDYQEGLDYADYASVARQLAELEACPTSQPEEFESAFHFYLDLPDWDLLKTYRERVGY